MLSPNATLIRTLSAAESESAGFRPFNRRRFEGAAGPASVKPLPMVLAAGPTPAHRNAIPPSGDGVPLSP